MSEIKAFVLGAMAWVLRLVLWMLAAVLAVLLLGVALVLLLLGGVLLWRQLRQQAQATTSFAAPSGAPATASAVILTDAERQRAQHLLEGHTR